MTIKKGQVLNPTGRVPGTQRKATRMRKVQLTFVNFIDDPAALMKARQYKTTPLDYMLQVINDPKASPSSKLLAAQAAAPYVHPKKPQLKTTPAPGGSGVMEVPVATSLESWAQLAQEQQADLLKKVRL